MSSTVRSLFWDKRTGRIAAVWRVVAYLVLAAVLTQPPVALLARIGNPLLSAAGGNIIGAAGFLVALVIVSRFLEKRTLTQYGLTFNKTTGVEFTLGLIAGALIMSAVFAVFRVAGWIRVDGD